MALVFLLQAAACGTLLSGREFGRRQLGVAAGSALLAAQLAAPRAGAAEDEMRTSANIAGYTDLTGEPGSSLGAGAMSGKSRPRTGVCLLEPVIAIGSSSGGKSIAVQSLVALDGGIAATTRFDSPYPLAVGFYYDVSAATAHPQSPSAIDRFNPPPLIHPAPQVETRSRDGDGAFLQVERLPAGSTLTTAPASWFLSTVLASTGRFGAYGLPTDVKLISDTVSQPPATGRKRTPEKRIIEASFAALAPGGSEQRRHAIISAIQPEGSDDAMLLVGGATELRWRKGATASALRAVVDSFELDSTRPTKIPRNLRSDYRVAEGKLFP